MVNVIEYNWSNSVPEIVFLAPKLCLVGVVGLESTGLQILVEIGNKLGVLDAVGV